MEITSAKSSRFYLQPLTTKSMRKRGRCFHEVPKRAQSMARAFTSHAYKVRQWALFTLAHKSYVNRPNRNESLLRAFQLSGYFSSSRGNLKELCVSRDLGLLRIHVGSFWRIDHLSGSEFHITWTTHILLANKYAWKSWCICTSARRSRDILLDNVPTRPGKDVDHGSFDSRLCHFRSSCQLLLLIVCVYKCA